MIFAITFAGDGGGGGGGSSSVVHDKHLLARVSKLGEPTTLPQVVYGPIDIKLIPNNTLSCSAVSAISSIVALQPFSATDCDATAIASLVVVVVFDVSGGGDGGLVRQRCCCCCCNNHLRTLPFTS